MTMRTTSTTIVFAHPFVLAGMDGANPAGAFVVETNEELLEYVSFPAWRRHSTVIRLHPAPGTTLGVTVDPDELAAALARDRALGRPPQSSRLESSLRGSHRTDKKMFLDAAKPRKSAVNAVLALVAARLARAGRKAH